MKGGTIQINWHETKPVLTLDFHPHSSTLATGGSDFDIKLWLIKPAEAQKKLPTVSYLNSLSYHSSAVNVIRFSSSGELLASGADGGDLIVWKLHPTDTGHTWKVLKMLRSHHKDILDLQWSTNGEFLISGSVDNCCIIWDVNKGINLQTLDAHAHYVQGVAWDPLGKYVASLSSDRTCRIYINKPQKSKGGEKMNYVCQHVVSKAEQLLIDKSKSTKYHLFHDETLPSFFRRLAWSPDGLFLLVPAGSYKIGSASESVNAAYIFSRKNLSRPAIQLPCANKAVVAVRFCPVLFSLRGTKSAGLFKLPYRVIFAVATLNSLYIYDTEITPPIAVFAGLHYASITDITWSPDAHYLALSSQDGFCTLVEFENDELGTPISSSEEKKISNSESSVQTDRSMVTGAIQHDGAVADSRKTEAEGRDVDMVGAVVADGTKSEAAEKMADMVIEAAGDVSTVVGDRWKTKVEKKAEEQLSISEGIKFEVEEKTDGTKSEAAEKTADMVIEAAGDVSTVDGDRWKTKVEKKAEEQSSISEGIKFQVEEKADKQWSNTDIVKFEEGKNVKKQPSTSGSDRLKTEAAEKAEQEPCSLKSTPISDKPTKKRITPMAIDP